MHAEFNCINPTLVALTESYLARWTLVQLVAAGWFRIISLRNVIRPETSGLCTALETVPGRRPR